MRLVVEIALGYVLGRFLAGVLGTFSRVVMRRAVLRSQTWQERIRHDDQLDEELKRAVGR